jgi:RNA polymerase sigma factor (TIGR02999 family)
MGERPEVTTLLDAMRRGDAAARDALYERVYGELHRVAKGAIRKSAGSITINPATLVHEVYLKLADDGARELESSHHFYSLMARAMRQVLIDLVRQRAAARHGGGQFRTELTERLGDGAVPIDELLGIDAALGRLTAADPELAELVELHFFGGLAFAEIARIRGVAERTVRRHWDMARAFLADVMPKPDDAS